MKNVHLQYKILPATPNDSVEFGQAYVKADNYEDAKAKLAKFLGKKVEFEVTQFADANAEVLA